MNKNSEVDYSIEYIGKPILRENNIYHSKVMTTVSVIDGMNVMAKSRNYNIDSPSRLTGYVTSQYFVDGVEVDENEINKIHKNGECRGITGDTLRKICDLEYDSLLNYEEDFGRSFLDSENILDYEFLMVGQSTHTENEEAVIEYFDLEEFENGGLWYLKEIRRKSGK